MEKWLITYATLGHLADTPPIPPNMQWTGLGGCPDGIKDDPDNSAITFKGKFTYKNMIFSIYQHQNGKYSWSVLDKCR
jgi:hypothetical protein